MTSSRSDDSSDSSWSDDVRKPEVSILKGATNSGTITIGSINIAKKVTAGPNVFVGSSYPTHSSSGRHASDVKFANPAVYVSGLPGINLFSRTRGFTTSSFEGSQPSTVENHAGKGSASAEDASGVAIVSDVVMRQKP